MGEVVIRVDQAGKRYRIGEDANVYGSLRETLMERITAPFRPRKPSRRASGRRGEDRDFWALRNVSFEVRQGEVLGIIGRNGAGKSTLLKLLSQVTEPTEGCIEIAGRVASLLEVGMGFHPELTGRENIYLNGAVLGMTRREIERAFDQIVAFAEVEEFIDTPVKRYSSGMYLRLAFSVSAHLQPEILIVDEVLAVGDTAFQRKCLEKMGSATRAGKTALFVSHDMSVIRSLCDRGIVLDRGAMVYEGRAVDAVAHYAHLIGSEMRVSRDLRDWWNRSGTPRARIVHGAVEWRGNGEEMGHVVMGDTLIIRFEVVRDADVRPSSLRSSCIISTTTGIPVLHISNEDDDFIFPDVEEATVTITVPQLRLFPGTYTVSLWVGNQHYDDYDYVRDCLSFDVEQGTVPDRAYRMSWYNGLVYHPSEWSAGT
ncbi:MAG TPA: ABC transporter ATP-binding protein [Chloroflexota bacterium]|nr:ABC transporter ATP-binding protein [Chloroflexota bacterium]